MLRCGGMRPIALSLLAVLTTLPFAAQEKLVETIEVRVVNIDVVVTDRTGKPVTGLTKDDFEILDNGVRQPITNLYEVRPENPNETLNVAGALEPNATPPAAAAPAEMRLRRLALFIDNSSLPVVQRTKVLKALDKFINDQMRPGDEATIVTWNPGLKIVTPFTSDRKELQAGIASVSVRANAGASDMTQHQDSVKRECNELIGIARDGKYLTMSQAWDQCKAEVNSYGEEMAHNAKNVLEGMRLTSTTLAGLGGKKVMVIAGAHLPERPGLELYMWAAAAFQPYMKGVNQMQALAETSHNLQTFAIDKFAHQANADGVTVYVIDAADSRDFTSAEASMQTDTTEQFAAFTNTAAAYQTIARVTGGMMVNSSNFDAAFDIVGKDLGSYYSLGYKPSGDAKLVKDHKIVVNAKNSAYRVRTRQSYAPKSSEEQIDDRVVANIYHSGVHSEWPIKISAGTPEKEGDRFRIPVQITIPATVTLLPQENQLVGGFSVYIAVGTDGGAMSKVSKAEQPIKIPASAENDLRSKPMTYDLSIVVRPGESTLSIGVVDQISSTSGFARTKIVAR
jgi:VWFA-related protein